MNNKCRNCSKEIKGKWYTYQNDSIHYCKDCVLSLRKEKSEKVGTEWSEDGRSACFPCVFCGEDIGFNKWQFDLHNESCQKKEKKN